MNPMILCLKKAIPYRMPIETVATKITYLRAKTTISCNLQVARMKNLDEDYGFS